MSRPAPTSLLPWLLGTALLACAPVLQTFARNADRLTPAIMIRPLLLALGVTGALGLLARLSPLRSARVGALAMASVVLGMLPFYAFLFADFLGNVGFTTRVANRGGAALALGLLGGLVGLALRPDTGKLRTLVGGVTAWIFLVAAADAVVSNGAVATAPLATRPLPATEGAPAERGDVVHVLLDGMPSPETGEELLGIAAGPWRSSLEERGLRVARGGHSQYAFTLASMASVLNLDRLPRDTPTGSANRRPLRTMVDRSAVFEAFRDAGYRLVVISTGGPGFEHVRADAAHHPWPTDFENRLISSSLLGALRPDVQYAWRRANVEDAFVAAREALAGPGPAYVLVHVLAPHAPAIWGEDGAPVDPPGFYQLGPANSLGLEEGRRRMVAQVRWVQGRVLRFLDALEPDPTRAVLVHGDHGPGHFYAGPDDPPRRCRAAFGTLIATRVPGRPEGSPPPDPGLVNLFRPLLETWFGVRVPARDRQPLFSTWKDPFALEPCPMGEGG